MNLLSAFSDVWHSFAAGFVESAITPTVNIDGTPMLNSCFDIHGNPFGVSNSSSLTDIHLPFDNTANWSSGGEFNGF